MLWVLELNKYAFTSPNFKLTFLLPTCSHLYHPGTNQHPNSFSNFLGNFYPGKVLVLYLASLNSNTGNGEVSLLDTDVVSFLNIMPQIEMGSKAQWN